MSDENYEVHCGKCGSPPASEIDWRCSCGSPFTISTFIEFDPRLISSQLMSLRRYQEFLALSEDDTIVSLGEPLTPLVELEPNVLAKCEFALPTGSFKDRGSSVAISKAAGIVGRHRLSRITEDSSGNAGASIAAYAAKAGISCDIYVPEHVHPVKSKQIIAYGATLHKISGPRDQMSDAAQKETERGAYYVGHVWNPYFTDGIRTLAYEIAEFTNWDPPDLMFVPTSAGTLLLGMAKGFTHLVESGLIETWPKLIAVQTEQVSPVYHALNGSTYSPPAKITSIADALISTNPIRLNEMVRTLQRLGGDAEKVDEKEIADAGRHLAGKGILVEPSSATAYAAYAKWKEEGMIGEDERVCLILTGSGLKSIT